MKKLNEVNIRDSVICSENKDNREHLYNFEHCNILKINSCRLNMVEVLGPKKNYRIPLCMPWNNGENLEDVFNALLVESSKICKSICISDPNAANEIGNLLLTNLQSNGNAFTTLVYNPNTYVHNNIDNSWLSKAIDAFIDNVIYSNKIPADTLFFIQNNSLYIQYNQELNKFGGFIVRDNVVRITLN